MGETQIDHNNQSSTTGVGHPEEFQAFISTGRTGRRNAIPDLMGNDTREKRDSADSTSLNVVHLAQQLQSLKTHSSINDGQIPSTSKSVDLTETLTQPTTNNMKVGR